MPIERDSNSNFEGYHYTLGERMLEIVFFPFSFSWFGRQDKNEKEPRTPSSKTSEGVRFYEALEEDVKKNEKKGMSRERAVDKAVQKAGR